MNPAALIHRPRLTSRQFWVAALSGLGLLLAVGITAPLIDGSHFRERILGNLELILGRSVQFEQVHFTLFSGPGFSIQGVTISEDPRYGIEPFAYVPEMEARVRLDKLLLGQIQISSLRLVEPSLNLVKRADGTWNVVELVQRLSAPRRMPMNLFPVFEVSSGRIDVKFGVHKTALYMLDSDLQIYPERSNRLRIRFSGSPARTDRAGNGFGHLHGTATWSVHADSANNREVQADLVLDASNLSEVATLVEGHDIGIHGTVGSHAVIEGRLDSLHVRGELQLADVHRWDLLPASGSAWQIRYGGEADLVGNRLALRTLPVRAGATSPVTLDVLVTNLLATPQLLLQAHLQSVPAAQVLPLGRRMGLPLPPDLSLVGNLGGDIRFSSSEGLQGILTLDDATAALPRVTPLHAEHAEAMLQDDRLRFRPAVVRTDSGTVQMDGELSLATTRTNASIQLENYSVADWKELARGWFGGPEAMNAWQNGSLSGIFTYATAEGVDPVWGGRFQFADSSVGIPGIAEPLRQAEGRASFTNTTLDVPRFSAHLGSRLLRGSYRYNSAARHTGRLHLESPAMDLSETALWLTPSLQAQDWLVRLGVRKRTLPAWLAERDVEAELEVKQLLMGETELGTLSAQLLWQGAGIGFSSLKLRMPEGTVQAHGNANLASYRPSYEITGAINRFPWRGGLLNANGTVATSGMGNDAFRNLQAAGSFAGTNLALTADDIFSGAKGVFEFSAAQGWPDLQVRRLQVSDDDGGEWAGAAAAQSDGRLLIDLEREGQQRHIVSALVSASSEGSTLVADH